MSFENYNNKNDQELMGIIVADPNSNSGKIAKECLGLKQKKTQERLNILLTFLTFAIAISTIFQVYYNFYYHKRNANIDFEIKKYNIQKASYDFLNLMGDFRDPLLLYVKWEKNRFSFQRDINYKKRIFIDFIGINKKELESFFERIDSLMVHIDSSQKSFNPHKDQRIQNYIKNYIKIEEMVFTKFSDIYN